MKKSNKLVGYKVTNHDRSRRVGMAVRDLQELRAKVKAKFNITCKFKVYLATDGSEIEDEDYFATLKEQTLLLVVEEGQKVESDNELLMSAMNHDFFEAGKQIREYIEKEMKDNNQFFNVLLQAKNEMQEKTESSEKDRHQTWFEGSDSNANTKEEVMRRRSQDRIRGYFYKFKDEAVRSELYKTNPKARKLLVETIEQFRYLLVANDYFSCLFDRSYPNKLEPEDDEVDATRVLSKKRRVEIRDFLEKDKFFNLSNLQKSLCAHSGNFKCFGPWFQSSCSYSNHSINPYASRENLILFQIWNLDHAVEFSRSVLPSLLENVSRISEGTAICKKHKLKALHVSVLTYFREFFTISNLKLVHIVCHDKGIHNLKSQGVVVCAQCEEYKFLVRLQELIDN